MSEVCAQHGMLEKSTSAISTNLALLQKDIEYLRRDQETILSRFGKHVEDAEKTGGRHERLKNVEDAVVRLEDQLRNDRIMSRWFMIGSGLISGGIVTGTIKIWAVISKTLGV